MPPEPPIGPQQFSLGYAGLKGASTTRRQLRQDEADNIRRAVVKYLSRRPTRAQAPFSPQWALALHREMFGDVWSWAGQPRRWDDPSDGVCHLAIGIALAELMEDL